MVAGLFRQLHGGDKRRLDDPETLGGFVHSKVEENWKQNGILSSEKKRVSDCLEVEELGALLQGEIGVLGGTPHRFCKLIQATLWMIGQKPLTCFSIP